MTRKILSILLALVMVFSVFAVSGSAAAPGDYQIVGEWLWASTIYDGGEGYADVLMARFAEMGITDLYLLVKGTNGTASFLKGEVPLARAYEDRDILQEAIDAAAPYGIRIHAWVCCFQDKTYAAANFEARTTHWVRGRGDGNTDTEKMCINLHDDGYQLYMSQYVAELVKNYDVAGVHLDYIRFNHMANGWGDRAMEYLEAMGANLDNVKYLINKTSYAQFLPEGETTDSSYIFNKYNEGDPDAVLIVEYRRNVVRNFAKTIINSVKAVDENLIVSAALQPEGAALPGTYDNAFANVHYGQNYEDAAELYDYITPMAYSFDFGKDSAWVAESAKGAVAQGNQVVMGLQGHYAAGHVTATLMSDVNACIGMEGVMGVALFRTTCYSYAKTYYDLEAGKMQIKYIDGDPARNMHWVRVDMAEGVKAVSASALGMALNTTVEIPEDGSYVLFDGTDIVKGDCEALINIEFEGAPAEDEAIVMVRCYSSNEARVLNVYEPSLPELPFEDVEENDWFYDDVAKAYFAGLMNGTSDTTFEPNNSTTRAMVVTVLWRMAGEPAPEATVITPDDELTEEDETETAVINPFTDVEDGKWYTDAVIWAVQNGITKGATEDTFQPEQDVTREQLAAFLYRYAQFAGLDVAVAEDFEMNFADVDKVSPYAAEAMKWACANSIINGRTGGILDPRSNATRAEMAAILVRFAAAK